MENMVHVTRYLRRLLTAEGRDPDRGTLNILQTRAHFHGRQMQMCKILPPYIQVRLLWLSGIIDNGNLSGLFKNGKLCVHICDIELFHLILPVRGEINGAQQNAAVLR